VSYDIEKEVNAYLEYNSDVFRGKTVFLPCDDPEWSNFTKYFAQNFKTFGLKKLISTSYAVESKKFKFGYQPTLFETEAPQFDKKKTRTNGKIFILTNGRTKVNVTDLKWDYLEGDGDFRSQEVINLRNEADIIITNPPFSLFREFLAWIVNADKQFLIIGNINSITYKEVFPLIKDNKLWLGPSITSGDREFVIPAEIVDKNKFTGEIRKNEKGEDVYFQRVVGVRWFTNLDHGRRHQKIPLMTKADNIKFSKHKEIKGKEYIKYENYDAIEVPYVDAIPSDYKGIMGVPISVLDKYSPEQFEILGTSDNGIISDKYKTTQGLTQKFVDDYYKAGGKGAYNEGNPTAGAYIDGVATMIYKRIFIKHKRKKNGNKT